MTKQDFLDANVVHRKLWQARAEGRMIHRILKQDPTDLKVVTMSDASFAAEPGCRSQAGFVTIVTSGSIEAASVPATLVEFQSSTIHRVVRSTLAAEAASLSTALDRQLYVRLVLEALLHGEPETTPCWRNQLRVPGLMVVDAKSLFDHLSTTGSIPKERQVMIDLLAARELVESGAVDIKWVPTTHMVADMLTKSMIPPEAVLRFLKFGWLSMRPTEGEQVTEDHRAGLRREQRQRRKLRMKTVKEGASEVKIND